MIYLFLSIASSAAIAIVMRLSEGNVKSKLTMLATNYLVCLLISWGMMGFGNVLPEEEGLAAALGMGTFNGFFYVVALVLNQYNISRNGVVMPSVFSKMGSLLIPLIMSIVVFSEVPTVFQFVGFVLSVAAIIIINYQKTGADTGNLDKLPLMALLVAEGCASIMAKVFNEIGNLALDSQFLFYTFFTALIFCSMLIVIKKERPGVKELIFGTMIGIPNFMSAQFMMKALEYVPAVIVYPFRAVAVILTIMLAGIVIFKERLTRQQWFATGVILVSLVLLNL